MNLTLNNAVQLAKKGKFKQAHQILERLIADEPDNIDILYNLGMTFSELGHPQKAIKTLEYCLKLQPDFHNARVALGYAYVLNNQLDQAEQTFLQVLQKDPDNAYALRNLGGIYAKKNNFDRAIAHLEKAYSLIPADPKVVYGLAQCHFLKNNLKEADHFAREVIKLNDPQSRELAKTLLSEIGYAEFRSRGARPDAVFYCVAAINLFKNKKPEQIRTITFEIALKGTQGYDVNNSSKKYTLRALPGEFTGLQLVAYMYVGFQLIDSSVNLGFDLSQEYQLAKEFANREAPGGFEVN